MSKHKPTRKYIFKCKLEGLPVCIVTNWANGVYADLLEECGVWHMITGTIEDQMRERYVWTVDYPLIIKHNSGRYDLKVGDQFTLS